MLRFIRENFDIKTFAITCTISVGWIFGTDFLVNHFLTEEGAKFAQTFKGTLFVCILSIILAIFHGREKNLLERHRKDFDRLFRKGLTPTILICSIEKKVLEANHAALSLLGYGQKSIDGLSMDKIFYDKDNWEHILKDLQQNHEGHAYLVAGIQDRSKNRYTRQLQISPFEFNQSPAYLIFIQKEGS